MGQYHKKRRYGTGKEPIFFVYFYRDIFGKLLNRSKYIIFKGKVRQMKNFLKNRKNITAIIVAAVVICMLLLSGCLPGANSFSEKDNGQSISIKTDEVVTILLESNATTGYGWVLSEETDASIVSLQSQDYKTHIRNRKLVGAGGFEIFMFRSVGQGSTDIVLNYRRPWEKDIAAANTFILKVDVAGE
jgi:inhibitor of cysteine peptidase